MVLLYQMVWCQAVRGWRAGRSRKGSRVLVRGRLEIGEWTTREGEVRTSYDIWADDVVNLTPHDGSPREEDLRDERAGALVGPSSRPAPGRSTSVDELDDLPF